MIRFPLTHAAGTFLVYPIAPFLGRVGKAFAWHVSMGAGVPQEWPCGGVLQGWPCDGTRMDPQARSDGAGGTQCAMRQVNGGSVSMEPVVTARSPHPAVLPSTTICHSAE